MICDVIRADVSVKSNLPFNYNHLDKSKKDVRTWLRTFGKFTTVRACTPLYYHFFHLILIYAIY